MTCGANVRSVVNATVIPTLGVRVVLRADEATTTDRTHQDPTALKDRPGLFIPARGAATSRRGERVLLRSIPARAGQPERDRSTIPAPRVHPRIGFGDSTGAAKRAQQLMGSTRQCSWPRCRSDRIQVVASGSVYAAGPIVRARLISASVCRRFTIERTGGTSDCRTRRRRAAADALRARPRRCRSRPFDG